MTLTPTCSHSAPTLRARHGPRPTVTRANPQTQLDQQPEATFSATLIARAAGLPGVHLAPSGRSPRGTIGFHLDPDRAQGPARAFMLDTEFAHVHPGPDHSLHMTLPPPVRAAAISGGWAELHPMAGQPTVSADLVLVYAPRDEAELALVADLVAAAWGYASNS